MELGKLILGGLVGAALMGAAWAAQTGSFARLSGNDPESVVKRLYAAFGKGDADAVRDLIAEDATWVQYGPSHILPFAGPRKGPDGVREFFSTVDKVLKDAKQTTREIVVDGDTVVALGQEESTVRKNGVRYTAHNAHVFKVRGGKIVAFEEYIDSGTIVLAFGQPNNPIKTAPPAAAE